MTFNKVTLDHIRAAMKGMWLQGATKEQMLAQYEDIGISEIVVKLWVESWGKVFDLRDKRLHEHIINEYLKKKK